MKKPPELTPRQEAAAEAHVAALQDALAAKPKRDDLVREFGEESFTQTGDSWAVNVNGHANVVKSWEMQKEYEAKLAAAGQIIDAVADKVDVSDGEGGKITVRESQAEVIERKRYRPGRRTYFTGGWGVRNR